MATKSGVTNISWIGTWGMEVSETLVLEVGGHQFSHLSSMRWIWTCFVQVLCTDGVCLDEPFSLKRPKPCSRYL